MLASSTVVPFRVPLPNDYRWLPLRQLLDADDNLLRIREGAVRRALAGGPGRSVVERPPGRPGVGSLILGEFNRRSIAGVVEPTVRAEAGVLWSWLQTHNPAAGSRTRDTIENIIRRAHSEWRDQCPRSTN